MHAWDKSTGLLIRLIPLKNVEYLKNTYYIINYLHVYLIPNNLDKTATWFTLHVPLLVLWFASKCKKPQWNILLIVSTLFALRICYFSALFHVLFGGKVFISCTKNLATYVSIIWHWVRLFGKFINKYNIPINNNI